MLNTNNQNQEPLTCPPSDTMMKEVRTDGTEINEIYVRDVRKKVEGRVST